MKIKFLAFSVVAVLLVSVLPRHQTRILTSQEASSIHGGFQPPEEEQESVTQYAWCEDAPQCAGFTVPCTAYGSFGCAGSYEETKMLGNELGCKAVDPEYDITCYTKGSHVCRVTRYWCYWNTNIGICGLNATQSSEGYAPDSCRHVYTN